MWAAALMHAVDNAAAAYNWKVQLAAFVVT